MLDEARKGNLDALKTVGVPCQPKEELAKVPALLAKLREQSGNAQLLELYNRHDELGSLSKQCLKTVADITKRLPAWRKLGNLLRHAKALGPYSDLKAEIDAIEAQRGLLAEPDPVCPLLDKTVARQDGGLAAPGAQRQAGRLPDGLSGSTNSARRRCRLEQTQRRPAG